MTIEKVPPATEEEEEVEEKEEVVGWKEEKVPRRDIQTREKRT